MSFDYLVLGAGATGLNTWDILATLFFFTLLMVLLKKFAWGPLMGIMNEREQLVASEIEAAENSRIESQKLLDEQRLKISSYLFRKRRNASTICAEAVPSP